MGIDTTPLRLSFELALISTAVLLLLGIPVARWVALSRTPGTSVVRAMCMLPLVLPPSVLGFFFLVLWTPGSWFGAMLDARLHLRLVFTFEGLVVASVIAGLPFMLNPLIAGFESVPVSLYEASMVLGKSPMQTLVHVILPSIRPSLMTGILMTFIHTFGEFGVVLMLGGKIPGRTVTASIALYDAVESLQYGQAYWYAGLLVACSLVTLVALFMVNNKNRAALL